METPRTVRACQDLKTFAEHEVPRKVGFDDGSYTSRSFEVNEVCTESREGVKNPEQDARHQLRAVIAGKIAQCRKASQCLSVETVGAVRVEEVKSLWEKLTEAIFGKRVEIGKKPSSQTAATDTMGSTTYRRCEDLMPGQHRPGCPVP